MAKLGVPPIHGPFCSVEMGLVNKTDVARLHGLVADTIIYSESMCQILSRENIRSSHSG